MDMENTNYIGFLNRSVPSIIANTLRLTEFGKTALLSELITTNTYMTVVEFTSSGSTIVKMGEKDIYKAMRQFLR